MRWEVFKAYICGQIINYTSFITNKTNKLTNKTKQQLEWEVNMTNSQTQDLVTLRAKYNALSAAKAENSWVRLKQTFYEQGKESGKLLASQIKKYDTERAINIILIPNGDIIVDPLVKNDTFVAYYQTLYKSELEEDQTLLLNQLPVPTISEDNRSWMDRALQSQKTV